MSTFDERQILTAAQNKGVFSTLLAYFRLSGPGWLQSAITLGGASLVGSLYLGMLGGHEMLWLQMVAIVIGVIMLSAISYVTLSTHQRPYEAINDHVNPVLGVGWVTATILANMIWILPQFSLCFDAIDKNLMPQPFETTSLQPKIIVSAILAVFAWVVVYLSLKPGLASRIFDIVLKLMIMVVLLCFVGVVVWLTQNEQVNWLEVLSGFVPDFSQWNQPVNALRELAAGLDESSKTYWTDLIVARQREGMISVTATAVGLNMTFLLPYSMLSRGWDKPFRGLARFDLITALAIPFLIVTTCIVIASAHAFHGKADASFLSNDPAQIQQSVMFESVSSIIAKRVDDPETTSALKAIETQIEILSRESQESEDPSSRLAAADLLEEAEAEKIELLAGYLASLDMNERKLALAMVKPNVAQLSVTLAPIFGENSQWSRRLLGIGALSMGFSTIVILTLINSLAFAEVWGDFEHPVARMTGATAALLVGFFWFFVWSSGSKTYLVIVASTFGAILLPIAYIAFFILMNSKRCLGKEKPTGIRRWIWNTLMGIGVLGAVVQAYGGITTKLNDPNPVIGPMVIGGCITFLLLAIVGFSARPEYDYSDEDLDE